MRPCTATLSSWHVPSQYGGAGQSQRFCWCGREATAAELDALRHDRVSFLAAEDGGHEYRGRYRALQTAALAAAATP